MYMPDPIFSTSCRTEFTPRATSGLTTIVAIPCLDRKLCSSRVDYSRNGNGGAVFSVVGEGGKRIGQMERRHADGAEEVAELVHVHLGVVHAAVEPHCVHHLLDAAEVELGGLGEGGGVDGVVEAVVDGHLAVIALIVVLQVIRGAEGFLRRVVGAEDLSTAGLPGEVQRIGPPGGVHLGDRGICPR